MSAITNGLPFKITREEGEDLLLGFFRQAGIKMVSMSNSSDGGSKARIQIPEGIVLSLKQQGFETVIDLEIPIRPALPFPYEIRASAKAKKGKAKP